MRAEADYNNAGVKSFYFFFAGALVFTLVDGYFYFVDGSRSWWFETATKCIPLLLLIGLVGIYSYLFGWRRYATLIGIGFVFSVTGDFLLELDYLSSTYFMCGMLAFFLAHASYATAFLLPPTKSSPAVWDSKKLYRAIPFLIYWVCVMCWFGPTMIGEGETTMFVAVCVYALGICTMAFSSTCRIGYTGNNEMLYPQIVATVGALNFVASDTILCYVKFMGHIDNQDYYVMVTYWLAQFCLGFSIVRSYNDSAQVQSTSANASAPSIEVVPRDVLASLQQTQAVQVALPQPIFSQQPAQQFYYVAAPSIQYN